MGRPPTNPEAIMIFEKLQQSDSFLPGYEKEKFHIIGKLLRIRKEMQSFANTPHRKPYEISGYLVECIARFSPYLPRNTRKAQELSETIIRFLHEHKLCNPDHLWMTIRGKRITVIGIGEVKSHPSVVNKRPVQLFLQQKYINDLIMNGMIKDTVLQTDYHVAFAENLFYYLIVPRSVNGTHQLPSSLPIEWQIRELEFSLPEIFFLKPILLADPEPPAGPTYSYQLYDALINTITKRMDVIMKELFKKLPIIKHEYVRNALMAWNILFKTIPKDQHGVDQIISWMRGLEYQHLFVPLLLTQRPESVNTIRKNDAASFKILMKRFEREIPKKLLKPLVTAFISRIAQIREIFPIQPPELINKNDIDLFTLI